MDKIQFDFNKLVYSLNDEHFICDYIFLDYWLEHLTSGSKKQGSRFCGVTGSRVQKITEAELEERIKDFDAEEYWQMAVAERRFTGSLDDYRDELESSGEIESIVLDEYHKEVKGLELAEGERLEHSGGGRCFDSEEMLKLYREKPEGFIIHDEALFKAIISVEQGLNLELREVIASAEIDNKYTKDKKKLEKNGEIVRHAKGLLKALEK